MTEDISLRDIAESLKEWFNENPDGPGPRAGSMYSNGVIWSEAVEIAIHNAESVLGHLPSAVME